MFCGTKVSITSALQYLHENGWPQVSVSVPPVGGTRGGAAGAQNALVEAVKLGPVLHGLEVLLGAMGPGGVVVAL